MAETRVNAIYNFMKNVIAEQHNLVATSINLNETSSYVDNVVESEILSFTHPPVSGHVLMTLVST